MKEVKRWKGRNGKEKVKDEDTKDLGTRRINL